MIWIDKDKEPRELTHYRSIRPKMAYNEMDEETKTALKKALLKESHYLCAYCMKRIDLDCAFIEHWKPQSDEATDALEYSNLLAVCDGGKSDQNPDLCCDSRKGHQKLTLDPTKEFHIQKIKYLRDGTICSDDPVISHDLNEVLNLNCASRNLKSNQCEVLNAFRNSGLKKFIGKKGEVNISRLKTFRSLLLGKTYRDPYVGIVIWEIDKIIRKNKND